MMKKNTFGTALFSDISSDIVCGTVKSISPVAVSVGESFTVSESRLIIPSVFLGGTVNVTIDGVSHAGTLSGGISVGDKVCMVRSCGGEKYVIIGVIGGQVA